VRIILAGKRPRSSDRSCLAFNGGSAMSFRRIAGVFVCLGAALPLVLTMVCFDRYQLKTQAAQTIAREAAQFHEQVHVEPYGSEYAGKAVSYDGMAERVARRATAYGFAALCCLIGAGAITWWGVNLIRTPPLAAKSIYEGCRFYSIGFRATRGDSGTDRLGAAMCLGVTEEDAVEQIRPRLDADFPREEGWEVALSVSVVAEENLLGWAKWKLAQG
jgi:hypothetical protein